MKALWAIYLRGLIILKNRIGKTLISFFLSPVLYALAFGWGVGRNLNVEGTPYLTFMLPGLIALSGMNQSFSIATEINTSRFFTHFFEEYLLSPSRDYIVVLGNILYGITKGMGSFIAVILIGFCFGVIPGSCFMIIVPVLLNSIMFSSLGILIALSVKNHRDMSSFSSFVITPMSFIAGTFFSLEGLPRIFHILFEVIPLTHSSLTIRALFLGRSIAVYHYIIMAAYALLFFFLAVRQVRNAVT